MTKKTNKRKRKIKRRSKTKLVRAGSHPEKRKIQVSRRKLKRRVGSEPGGGAPSKLTLTARKIVYAAIEAGLPMNRCHGLIGVSPDSFNKYLKYGEDERLRKFYHFRQKIKRIQKERELEALNVIRTAGRGGFKITKTKYKTGNRGTEYEKTVSTMSPQWQAAAWFLERSYKDVYGREISKEDKTPQEYAQEILEASQLVFNSVPTEEEEAA